MACDRYRWAGDCECQYNPDPIPDVYTHEGRHGHTEVDEHGVEVDRCTWCRMDPKTRKVKDDPEPVVPKKKEVSREQIEKGLAGVEKRR
jgi:hypothetical protein